MRKAVKIGFIGVFCAVIGLAFPVFNIFSKQLSMDSHENRLMTGLPQVLQSPLRELPRNLDNFLVDNSPFRYQFVLVNAGLDYALFFDHAGDDRADQLRTLHALIVCSLMTLLVFALLALSSIPVLRAIGSTVAIGVFANFVLALLVSRQPVQEARDAVA